MHRVAVLTAAAALALPAAASAADPGRWVLTNVSSIPYEYLQGVTSDHRNFWFVGPDHGLARTTTTLQRVARVDNVIPPDVVQRERYNHIGDPAFRPTEAGGDVLLPLECFFFGQPDPNTCRTGSIGVADPATLRWRYYVKLDPAVLPKAMWVERSPEGLLWTSAGDDLLAFRSDDVSPANAAPGAAPIPAVRQVPGAVAGMHVAGGAFYRGRLLLAGTDTATKRYIVRSFDPLTGSTRLEIEHTRGDEAEGIDVVQALGGVLHWVMSPGGLGSPNELLTYHPAGSQLRLRVFPRRVRPGRTRLRARVTTHSALRGVRGVTVAVAGHRAKTSSTGRASLDVVLRAGRRYRVTAKRSGLRSASATVRVTSR